MSIKNPADLLSVNVNEHTEKKNNLTYLSWAWAWAEVLKADPAATFKVEMFNDKCFMEVNGTAMVWVTVTMFNKPMTCQLPVMDYRNKPIQSPDAFAVNTAIMRCLAKAVALHGLGLYIYAGEDMPEEDKEAPKPAANPQPQPKKEIDPQTKGNNELFKDSVIEYAVTCPDTKNLNSFWKNNSDNLKKLKEESPDMYDEVLKVFSEHKKRLTEAETKEEA